LESPFDRLSLHSSELISKGSKDSLGESFDLRIQLV
jgi:hypothetical protein